MRKRRIYIGQWRQTVSDTDGYTQIIQEVLRFREGHHRGKTGYMIVDITPDGRCDIGFEWDRGTVEIEY